MAKTPSPRRRRKPAPEWQDVPHKITTVDDGIFRREVLSYTGKTSGDEVKHWAQRTQDVPLETYDKMTHWRKNFPAIIRASVEGIDPENPDSASLTPDPYDVAYDDVPGLRIGPEVDPMQADIEALLAYISVLEREREIGREGLRDWSAFEAGRRYERIKVRLQSKAQVSLQKSIKAGKAAAEPRHGNRKNLAVMWREMREVFAYLTDVLGEKVETACLIIVGKEDMSPGTNYKGRTSFKGYFRKKDGTSYSPSYIRNRLYK